MAQQFNSPDFGTLVTPSAVAKYNVQTANAGLASSGIVMIVGEADAGPDYTLETNGIPGGAIDLSANSFGPSEVGEVIAKYQSGPIVDAVSQFASPSTDPNITGAPTAFIIAKTNVSTQATGALTDWNSSTWGTLGASVRGAGGNNISYQVDTNTAEVVPTTGAFTMLVPISTFAYSIRVNGGTAQTGGTVSGGTLPSGFVSNLSGVTGITASGGVNRGILAGGNVGDAIAIVIVAGQAATFTISGGTYAAATAIGDTLWISGSSAIAAASGNSSLAGSWVVTAISSATQIQATKLMDASGSPGANTTIAVGTSSVTVGATSDLEDFSPVTIATTAANPVDGLGKSLEIANLTSSPDQLSNCAYALSSTKVAWLSNSGSPQLLTSASEYSLTLDVNNIVTNQQESLTAGGEIALQVGYSGTSATLQVTATTVVVTTVGGPFTHSPLTLAFKNFPSIASIALYLNAQLGFTAQAGNGILGMLPSTALDEGTFNIGTTFGAQTGRLKVDSYRFQTRAVGQSVQVQLVGTVPPSGIPEPSASPLFLAGGARGGSADSNITGAMDALQNVVGNFLVPLFSQDATADILAGETDPSSTYDIATINAYAKTHVILMSNPKRKKSRQALLSVNGTFAQDQTSASNIASFRCTMCFQSVQNVSASTSTLTLFQPWALAGLAASMQAAGFYKGIVNKYFNANSIVDASGDYNDQDDDQETVALQSGLLPAKRDLTGGGVFFVSDQTTYGSDSNFVYNSLQAVYIADTMALTLAQRMQKAFVGQSLADISATQAVAFVKNVLADFLTLKLIAPSDGAAKGYVPGSIVAKISGTAMTINLTVYLAGLLYFVPIVFQINQVSQTATA